MPIGNFRDLLVWQKAMSLVETVYRETPAFPKEEQYGLMSQMRRSVVSIPSNIAEGKRRSSDADFRRFLFMAFGGGGELETQIEISMRLGYLEKKKGEKLVEQLEEVMRMLNGFLSKSF
jgi:four helix bundle protein